jgi:hypothetical protein
MAAANANDVGMEIAIGWSRDDGRWYPEHVYQISSRCAGAGCPILAASQLSGRSSLIPWRFGI